MKTLNETSFEKLDLTLSVIVQPMDKANERNKGNKVKRSLDGGKYIAYDYEKHIEIYSNSQLRLMLNGEKDAKRLVSIRKILKKRGCLK